MFLRWLKQRILIPGKHGSKLKLHSLQAKSKKPQLFLSFRTFSGAIVFQNLDCWHVKSYSTCVIGYPSRSQDRHQLASMKYSRGLLRLLLERSIILVSFPPDRSYCTCVLPQHVKPSRNVRSQRMDWSRSGKNRNVTVFMLTKWYSDCVTFMTWRELCDFVGS